MKNSSPKNIRIADFDYPLPDARIARYPLAQRDACKLLVSESDGEIKDSVFHDLPELIAGEGLLVVNNTRVIHARIPFRKPTGAEIEVFLLEPLEPEDYVLAFQTRNRCEWSCMVGNLKKWKEDFLEREVCLAGGTVVVLRVRLGEPCKGNARRIKFEWDNSSATFADIVEAAGAVPIPPYLKRESEKSDETDYQTIYGKIKGSVAAPTAGLHFTPELLGRVAAAGQSIEEVTLHVGAGTFQPVKSEEIGGHPMHTEVFSISSDTLLALASALERGVVVTAVGTTSVRTLESLPHIALKAEAMAKGEIAERPLHLGQWEAYETVIDKKRLPELLRNLAKYLSDKGEKCLEASTSIMIAPGFIWSVVGRMVTNFHQPSSTLLLLVSSFLEPMRRPDDGRGEFQWRKIYRHALEGDYRFLSYGDACLLNKLQ